MENKMPKFNSLTPDILKENKKVYTDALDYAFSNDDIRNIAITGVYGAGKSTVWNTYKNNKLKEKYFKLFRYFVSNPFEKVITVCLGKYVDNTNKKGSEGIENSPDIYNEDNTKKENNKIEKVIEKSSEIENRVERQIINQILSQIESKYVPLSKYKFKGNKSFPVLLFNVIQSLFFIGSILLWILREPIVKILSDKLPWFNLETLFSLSVVMFFPQLLIFCLDFIKQIK